MQLHKLGDGSTAKGTYIREINIHTKKNSVAFSPQANYTDRATATCGRSCANFLRIEGVAWSVQRIPTAVNLGFLDRNIHTNTHELHEIRTQPRRRRLR
jgi:hypothetical protein